MPNTSFGELLLNLRKKNELTQEELADKIGRTYVAVGDWERGKRNPSKRNAEALAKALKLYGEDRANFMTMALVPQNPNSSESKESSIFSVSVDTALESNELIHKLAMEAAKKAAQNTATRAYMTTVEAMREGFQAILSQEELEKMLPRLTNFRRLPSGEPGTPSIVTPMENPTGKQEIDETID